MQTEVPKSTSRASTTAKRADSYVIVKGSTPEFDYPKGKDNVYAAYDGTGGVPIGAMARRMLFAYYFNDPNLLLSSYITSDSRIMIRRNIQERVRHDRSIPQARS